LLVSLFSPTPVLSIVVPHGGREDEFEASLVSVLENRPPRSEVLVCHDGSYADPFQLGDEVRFVETSRGDLPSQVLAAAEVAQGRLLHVLADGNLASEGWTDAIFDCFEDEAVGSVAPAILAPCQTKTATIGWTQGASSLCAPVAAHKRQPSRHDRAAVVGSYLSASFWRTDLLRAVAEVPHAGDAHVAAVAWTILAHACGFHCHSELTSQVVARAEGFDSAIKAGTARHLQSIATVADNQSAIRSGLVCLLANLHRPSRWSEAVGRMTAVSSDARFQRSLRETLPAAVSAVRDASAMAQRPATLKMPQRSPVAPVHTTRRAA